ncbi:MAG TPA: metal-dependent transcriptional regulator [Actinomycetota bacterium]|nr:metal-dependent transcriptional regulator [Actinomycetota bacterium]
MGKNSVQELSKPDREALKAIYRLTRAGDEAHTGALAEGLGVSPGTVTGLLKRLSDRGYVDYRPYHGVGLTRRGRAAAVAAIRRHRIVERFLSDLLGYAWNEADRLARTFEHDLPQEVEDRLYEVLDRPSACPHGFPIPEREAAELPDLPQLYDLEPGQVATVAVPGSVQPDVAEFLDGLGLHPGARVEVRDKQPFDGPIVLRVAGEDRVLGSKVARDVYVTDVQDRSA